ncbi:hypothetical protein VKT23_019115 [Stygiomarasmius scandens]|uniref:F-box domain-containing protein n=1 Tax=Marasmiellus scandens TaxID=2682957 RepID=A0ABR1IQE9_9AGAR
MLSPSWDRISQNLKAEIIYHVGFDKATLHNASLGFGRRMRYVCQQRLFTKLRFSVEDAVSGRLNHAEIFLQSRPDLLNAVKDLIIACEDDRRIFQRGLFLEITEGLVNSLELHQLEVYRYTQEASSHTLHSDNHRLICILKLVAQKGVRKVLMVHCRMSPQMWFRSLEFWDNLQLLCLENCSAIECGQVGSVGQGSRLPNNPDLTIELLSCDYTIVQVLTWTFENRHHVRAKCLKVTDDHQDGDHELDLLIRYLQPTSFVWRGYDDGYEDRISPTLRTLAYSCHQMTEILLELDMRHLDTELKAALSFAPKRWTFTEKKKYRRGETVVKAGTMRMQSSVDMRLRQRFHSLRRAVKNYSGVEALVKAMFNVEPAQFRTYD